MWSISSVVVIAAGLWLSSNQAVSLMWPFRANNVGGGYDGGYGYQRPMTSWGGNSNLGDASGNNWRPNSGSNWGGQTWPQPNRWPNSGQKGQQKPPKGSEFQRCYDSTQCRRGECCQYQGYSNVGVCRYDEFSARYGCRDSRPDPYPNNNNNNNNKGGGWPPRQNGRPGSCPPSQHSRDPPNYCRTDEDCPALQKCCYVQKNRVCQHPIFAGQA